jgi:hypothetical protein
MTMKKSHLESVRTPDGTWCESVQRETQVADLTLDKTMLQDVLRTKL